MLRSEGLEKARSVLTSLPEGGVLKAKAKPERAEKRSPKGVAC
jgi:hypothetical protein